MATIYGGYQSPETSWWDTLSSYMPSSRTLAGGFGLAGTGLGIWDAIQGNRAQQQAYDFARRQAQDYDRLARDYYNQQATWRNQSFGQLQGLMGQAIGAMMAPPINSYKPMTDSAMKAARRATTAQAALRTGGNEGGYIDDLVAERAIKDDISLREAAARVDAIANQSRMQLWPAILSAFAAAMGQGGPVAPLRPVGVPFSPPANRGSMDAFGNFLKWDTQQSALDAEREANRQWRASVSPFSQGPAIAPRSVYGGEPMYDYEGPW